MQQKYTWNDQVRIHPDAPMRFKPGAIATVVGTGVCNHEKTMEKTGAELGESTYTVEYLDGSDAYIAEKWLLPDDGK